MRRAELRSGLCAVVRLVLRRSFVRIELRFRLWPLQLRSFQLWPELLPAAIVLPADLLRNVLLPQPLPQPLPS